MPYFDLGATIAWPLLRQERTPVIVQDVNLGYSHTGDGANGVEIFDFRGVVW
jgi:hypothetical protein